MPGTKGKSGGSRLGNLSGKRGRGSKEKVGATVNTIKLDKPTAKSLRIVCLDLYGTADKDTASKHVTNLVLADWREWDQRVQENAEKQGE